LGRFFYITLRFFKNFKKKFYQKFLKMSRIFVNFLIFKILHNIPNLTYLHNIPKLHPRGYNGE
jgi:hypothetical protein